MVALSVSPTIQLRPTPVALQRSALVLENWILMGLKDSPDTNPHLAARSQALFYAIAKLKDAEACEKFFTDLCSPGELAAMADRWAVAQLLDKRIPYRHIQQETSVSTATITRVARALTHGEGGYRGVLDALRGEK